MTRNVLITGANGGVGTALSQALADDGWRVLAGVRSDSAATAMAALDPNVEPVALDITDEASIAAAARKVADAVGAAGLHGLVNNAGIIVQGPLELVPVHALRRQFEVNVIGQMAITQALLPLLRGAKGTVVNMGAASGRVTVPMLGPISASKTALESLTDALRMELKHQGVGVTIIEPGALQTAIFDKAAASAAADGHAGSEATRRLYAVAIKAATESMANQKPAPVDAVVKTVVKALSSGNPDPRYVVGRDAGQLMMLRRLPQGMRDRLLMNAVGLKPDAFSTSGDAARQTAPART
ncbi:MAG TPA: SDR family NAD(P)-dependent oxidoreductase [Methylomirabilota bacterium]|nr:SDR family NAD(P)-dependent oxidoreductase [Methylomirabilota bacterium]